MAAMADEELGVEVVALSFFFLFFVSRFFFLHSLSQ
jgi:hypothetical protein